MKLLVHCALADADHRRNRRFYAHVLHEPGCICVARAFASLPEEYACGILLHELGHLIDPDEEDEHVVDAIATKAFGIKVRRRDCKYGRDLEYVARGDVERAARAIAKRVK